MYSNIKKLSSLNHSIFKFRDNILITECVFKFKYIKF